MLQKTKKTGCTCVGDIRLSALDVGFDLRVVGRVVELPEEVSSVGYDADGETWLATGTRDELLEELRLAGYRIDEKAARHFRGTATDHQRL